MAWRAHVPVSAASAPIAPSAPLRRLVLGLAGSFMFGLGYFVYVTFVVTWLRKQRLGEAAVTGFHALLGLATMASP
jgi:hypothetical protein